MFFFIHFVELQNLTSCFLNPVAPIELTKLTNQLSNKFANLNCNQQAILFPK